MTDVSKILTKHAPDWRKDIHWDGLDGIARQRYCCGCGEEFTNRRDWATHVLNEVIEVGDLLRSTMGEIMQLAHNGDVRAMKLIAGCL